MSFVEFAACSSHQAATNIVKYLIQEHNNMSRAGVEPRPFDSIWSPEKRRSRPFGHAADVTKNDFKIIQYFWLVDYISVVRVKTIVKLSKGKYKPIKPIG